MFDDEIPGCLIWLIVCAVIASIILSIILRALEAVETVLEFLWNILRQILEFFRDLLGDGDDTPVPTVVVPPTLQPSNCGNLVVGERAVVKNTGGKGLRCRSGPGLASDKIKNLADGTEVAVIDGPVRQDDFNWWQVEPPDGQDCWAAGNWLCPLP